MEHTSTPVASEPLYPFTVAEIRRLWACRQAILFGYYSDQIADQDDES